MLLLKDYQFSQLIFCGNHTTIYRGIRTQDGLPIVAKTCREIYPNSKILTQLKHEFNILETLNFSGISAPLEFVRQENRFTLILEDFGGESLQQLLSRQPLTLANFLKIAITLTEIIAEIHAKGVIHKNINPANIIINLATEEIKLIDFGISSQLTTENQNFFSLQALEGDLAYISPEQTGRMNRVIDYRTDFYSLGVTFYEMLTGKLPFESANPLELIHSHIAKSPPAPQEENPEIPTVVSEIVMKLLQKMAEERYQTAFGILADLKMCSERLNCDGTVASFKIAQKDLSSQFQLPQKLYGREQEIQHLMAAFQRISGQDAREKNEQESPIINGKNRSETILVSGYSGLGKSSLVEEIYKSISNHCGFFVRGKFDKFQNHIPYSALIQALQELIRQILTESEESIANWCTKLLKALDADGQIIIDLIPEVELIIGPQPSVPVLGGIEAQNRFNWTFQQFIQVFARPNLPLVLFIDDLQWADWASLGLLRLLVTAKESKYLLLIGAYRDNEVNPSHPLMTTVNEIEEAGGIIERIPLKPLSLDCVASAIKETFHCKHSQAEPLAQLCLQKTSGNPFFINLLLKSLYDEEIFKFDANEEMWKWDLEQIRRAEISENVIEFMSGKIERLNPESQEILKISACFGDRFDFEVLRAICEKPRLQLATELWQLLQQGFIIPLDAAYKIPLTFGGEEKALPLETISYKFAGERIQHASYRFASEAECHHLHLKIGRFLLEKSSDRELEARIFEIINHLNIGAKVLDNPQQLHQLALLNQKAGTKAKDSTAYQLAAEYFSRALEQLKGDIWTEHYELALFLHQELSECEYLCGHGERAEQLFDIALSKVRSLLERVYILELRLALYNIQGKYREILQVAAEMLFQLNVELPIDSEQDILASLQQEVGIYSMKTQGIEIASLIELPQLSDPTIDACMRLLSRMGGPAYFCSRELLALVCLKMVNFSLEYGNSQYSSSAYACWGVVLGSQFGQYEVAYKLGQLALALNESYPTPRLNVFNLFGGFISPWRSHFRESIPFLRKGYEMGIKIRDVEASYNASNLMVQLVLANHDFEEILVEVESHLNYFEKIRNIVFSNDFKSVKYFIFNLQGLTLDKFSLSTDKFNEQECVELLKEAQFFPGVARYYIFKTQIFFLYGDYRSAKSWAEESKAFGVFTRGTANEVEPYYYQSLILAALYLEEGEKERQQYWDILEKNRSQLQIWADNCPENFLNKYLLVEAEMARISDKCLPALEFYDRAIASARENGFVQNEAIANELAAKFWLAKDKTDFAKLYIEKARYAYQCWGATRKVEDLNQQYRQLLDSFSEAPRLSAQTAIVNASFDLAGSSHPIDLAAVTRAARAISSEIVLDRLLDKLMALAIENAGAQRGFLILPDGDRWQVRAASEVDRILNFENLQSLNIDNGEILPLSIFQYVQRTQDDVVLADASCEERYLKDPYIARTQPKSVLAAPILHQGQTSAIVYLENNLITNAFTPDRLETLKILSSQAAISIENARFYQTLEAKVNQRTAQLVAANAEIAVLNQRLQQENLRMSAELNVAKQLQYMVLPKKDELAEIEELDIAGYMEPADEVGGDYYDVWRYDGGIKIAIGDVTGHGLESGVLTIMAQTAARSIHNDGQTDLLQSLNTINCTLFDNTQRMKCDKSMSLAILDYRAGAIELSGQHEEVIIVRAEGTIERIDTLDLGFPLALERDISPFVARSQVRLESGDIVLLYSDGVTEAFDPDCKEYGIERLCEVLVNQRQHCAEDICRSIVEDVRQHIGTQKVFDDITLLVLKQRPIENQSILPLK